MSKGLLPTLAAATTGVQVGAAIVATRFAVDQAGPLSLALLRYAIGAACLLPFALAVGRVRFAPRDLLPIGLLGILQFAAVIALLNYALQSISSGRAALIFATFPLITMVLAALVGHERLTPAKTAGVLLTVAGVGLALGERVWTPGPTDGGWIGEAAAFASAFCGAACSVLYRPYLRTYPALPVGAVAMLASVAFLAVAATTENFFAAWPSFTPSGWAAVVFIGLSSGIGYFLWLWALRHAAATRVTVFLSLSPITAAFFGALLLGEPLTMPLLAGLAAVVAGLWLAHR